MYAMSDILLTLKAIAPYITGGIGGAVFTLLYNKHKGRIQVMQCHYIEHEVISRIPTTSTPEGEILQNIYAKQFILRNTTNFDHKSFKVIFEFDVGSKIIRHTDTTKAGVDRLKKKLLKPNEYSVTVVNFNRGDEVKFVFEIANISADEVNVTEHDCLGFRIKVRDKRTARLESKLTQVDKAKLNR